MNKRSSVLSPDESFDQVLDTVRRALFMDLAAEDAGPARPPGVAYTFVPPIDGRPEKGPAAAVALDEFLTWLHAEEAERIVGRRKPRRAAGLAGPKAAAAEPEKPVAPQRPPDVTAKTLGLRAGMTADDLKHLRRVFALHNHPDRFVAAERDDATRRMRQANSLIDDALSALARRKKRA